MSSLFGNIGTKFVAISNKVTPSYEGVYGYVCNVYFPLTEDVVNGSYNNINIFSNHGLFYYNAEPDIEGVKFIIPYLNPKESINSSESIYDNFYSDEIEREQPFIETTYDNELPTASKIEIEMGSSKIFYQVDKKVAVPLASGIALIRMHLIPMTLEAEKVIPIPEED